MLVVSQVQALQTMKNEKGETVTGHIISTTIGGKNGEPKRVSVCLEAPFLAVCPPGARLNAASFSALALLSLLCC
jgi:hypothetical protein